MGSSARECEPLLFANPILSAEKSLPSTGQLFPATTTCASLPALDSSQMELPLMSSAAAGRAKISAWQEMALAWTASAAAYGRTSRESLAKFNRATRSWKTWQLCLDGDLEEFSATWPRSGMMRNGTAYQLAPLVPLTDAIEFGLLPTPSAVNYGTNQGGGMGRTGPVWPSLETMARKNLWPTPTAGDAKDSGSRNTPDSNAHPGTSLTDGGRGRMWPTPNAADASRGMDKRNRPETGGDDLTSAVRMWASPAARDYRSGRGRSPNGHAPQLPEQVNGQLNPTWVEWLMGLPTRWTVASGLSRSATRLSRKSLK